MRAQATVAPKLTPYMAMKRKMEDALEENKRLRTERDAAVSEMRVLQEEGAVQETNVTMRLWKQAEDLSRRLADESVRLKAEFRCVPCAREKGKHRGCFELRCPDASPCWGSAASRWWCPVAT